MSEIPPPAGEILWLNGHFTPIEMAAVSPFDRGFLYGDGLFETIRAQDGRVLYLEMHLERLYASLEVFRIKLNDSPGWEALLGQLLRKNGLTRGAVALKIIVTRGVEPALGLPPAEKPTVCITTRPYDPPPRSIYEAGWKLHLYRNALHPLAPFKTLNYLYCLTARQAALDAGCDEAILVDHDGLVSETPTGSLLARSDGRWWTPESRLQLPGTTIRRVSEILRETGSAVERRPAGTEDLLSAQTVWILNSLMGVMPVSRIDARLVPDPAAEGAARVRELLVGGK
jgi:branched-chain amino acid aminotransferase/para-aminobenzoate synthetase component 1